MNEKSLTTREFQKLVRNAIFNKLHALNEKWSRKKGIHVMDISPNAIGWLGLNTVTFRGAGTLEINPVVGIRHQNLEFLLSELEEEAYDKIIPPTLATSIGYLLPEKKYLPFYFSVDTSIEDGVNHLCDLVNTCGMTFFKETADLKTLVDYMQNTNLGIIMNTEYRLPVALHMLGDNKGARAYLDSKLAKIEGHTYAAANNYRRFASNLYKLLQNK